MSLQTLLSELNESQQAAATIGRKHALILAGAGCGKTKTIVARAAYLIANGTHSKRIQILTFTRRAAAEIVERVRMHLGDDAVGLQASTFHAWCISLIRRAPHIFGCKDYSVIDRDDQLQLFRVLRGKDAKSSLPTAAQLCDLYSFARNTGKTLDATLKLKLPEAEDSKQQIGQIMLAYEAKKRERKYLDYDDILDVVAVSIHQKTEARDWVAGHYDHLLIDEMQDTNPLQWRLIDPLRHQATLFCVGDDAQSIYGFRGADFRNVHSFKERVPEAEVLRLERNYRSTQEILDAANWLLNESPINYKKNLEAVRGPGKQPRIINFRNEWDESRWVAADILRRRAEGDDWRKHMVLVRSGFAGRAIEGAFLDNNIPYVFIGGTKLLESAHVRDVLSVLRIVGNSNDEIAWMRYLMLWPGFGEVSANRLLDKILQHNNLGDCLSHLSGNAKLSGQAAATLQLAYENRENVEDAFSATVKGLEELLSNRYRTQQWENRKRDFKLVAQLAGRNTSILGFIEEYLLDPIHSSLVDPKRAEDAVTIITVHSAKGTEREVCYVVNVSPGAYPSSYAVGNLDDIEEERRVLYVALTRAMNELIVTRQMSNRWTVSNETDDNGKEVVSSYFFNDLPEELYEEELPESEQRQGVPVSESAVDVPVTGISLGFDISVALSDEAVNLNRESIYFADNKDGTVTDKRTGLMWPRTAVGQEWDGTRCIGVGSKMSFAEALMCKVSFAGYDDWRLPTGKELRTLVFPSMPGFHDSVAFPAHGRGVYWTASHLENYPDERYVVCFSTGIDRYLRPNNHALIRLVRGELTENLPVLTDNGDGTVTDPRTGLQWMRLYVGQCWDSGRVTGRALCVNFGDAQKAARPFAGYNDWRLPSCDEIRLLCSRKVIMTNKGEPAFPKLDAQAIWCSTLYDGVYPYYADLLDPWMLSPTGPELELAVRLVR